MNGKSNQVTGNIGLYYVCYELSRRGWNVMPTSRNAKGVDIIAYNHDASKRHTIQVKTLTKKDPVPFGSSLDSLRMNDYLIICTGVYGNKPEVFIARPDEIQGRIHKAQTKRGKSVIGLRGRLMSNLLEGVALSIIWLRLVQLKRAALNLNRSD